MTYTEAKELALQHVHPQLGEVRFDVTDGQMLEIVGFSGSGVHVKVTHPVTAQSVVWGELSIGWSQKVKEGTYRELRRG